MFGQTKKTIAEDNSCKVLKFCFELHDGFLLFTKRFELLLVLTSFCSIRINLFYNFVLFFPLQIDKTYVVHPQSRLNLTQFSTIKSSKEEMTAWKESLGYISY